LTDSTVDDSLGAMHAVILHVIPHAFVDPALAVMA
jgi:hypothetical protein